MANKQKLNFNIKKEAAAKEVADEKKPLVESLGITEKVEKIKELDKKKETAFDFRPITRDKIRTNKKNRYDMVDIESLEDSILHFGLMHNLVVIYSVDEDKYILEAGHRRVMALDNLIARYNKEDVDKDSEEYKLYEKNVEQYKYGYPCKVSARLKDDIDYDYAEDVDLKDIPEEIIDSEIRVIISNEEARETSPAIKAQNIARLKELYDRKNLGKKKDEKINVNEQIAKEMNISTTMVKKYNSINKLIPELKEEFEQNNITLSESSNYAKLDEEEQKAILDMLKAGKKVSEKEIKILLSEKKQLANSLEATKEKIAELEKQKEELRKAVVEADKRASEKKPETIVVDNSVELAEKEKQIAKLKVDVAKLQEEAAANKLKKSFSAEQANLAKKELAVKSAYESCKREIKNLQKEIEILKLAKKNTKEDVRGMGIITEEEIKEMLRELNILINKDL